jgi:hypothetical protein
VGTNAAVFFAVWIVLVLVAVVAAAATIRARRRRAEELAAADAPSRRELAATRRAALEPRELRLLAPSQRARYVDGWRSVEATFAADPEAGVALADHTTRALAVELGYPNGSFHDLAAELALDFPEEIDDFCLARAIVVANEERPMALRQLKRAFKGYRALFAKLVAPIDFTERERDTRFFDVESGTRS